MVVAMGFRPMFRYGTKDAPATDDAPMQDNALKIKNDINHRVIVDQFDKFAEQGDGPQMLVDRKHNRGGIGFHAIKVHGAKLVKGQLCIHCHCVR